MRSNITLAFSCGARSAFTLKERSYLRSTLPRRQLQGFVGRRRANTPLFVDEGLAGAWVNQNFISASGLQHHDQMREHLSGILKILPLLPVEFLWREGPILPQGPSTRTSTEGIDSKQHLLDITRKLVYAVNGQIAQWVIPRFTVRHSSTLLLFTWPSQPPNAGLQLRRAISLQAAQKEIT
jgi:hypothetical protein